MRARAVEGQRPISIHALLAESDRNVIDPDRDNGRFYPRSPCGERLQRWARKNIVTVFLSTLSLRRATKTYGALKYVLEFLSTLSLRRATRIEDPVEVELVVSIHALLAESDDKPAANKEHPTMFLSTLSLRRATLLLIMRIPEIHGFYPRSPCGERQTTPLYSCPPTRRFYPRSPCGERLTFAH